MRISPLPRLIEGTSVVSDSITSIHHNIPGHAIVQDAFAHKDISHDAVGEILENIA